jgi:hypothetical protein
VEGRLHCGLKERFEGGTRGSRPVTAGGLDGVRLTRRLEVGGGPDGQAPPVGV